MPILLLLAAVVLFVVIGIRQANHNYTIGSGMFKSSDDHITGQRQKDASDFDYYNDTDKMK